MERLKREFERQLRATVNPIGNVIIGTPNARGKVIQGASFTPTDVLNSDNVAYEIEAENWMNTYWLPSRKARLEALFKLADNKRRFDDLCACLDREAVVPFVGAGMSRASGMPNWSGLLELLLEKSNCDEAAFQGHLARYEYEAAADLLFAGSMPDLFNERMSHVCRVERIALAGPVVLLPDLFTRLIITTNFDQVLEGIYAEEGAAIDQIFAGADIATFSRTRDNNRPILLKIHGDYLNEASRVFTSAEYDAVYKSGHPLYAELQTAARNSTLLFMGASLGSDRTVAVLKEAAAQNINGPKHYAFLPYIRDATARKRRELELVESRIFPIWFEIPAKDATVNDFDVQIEALLVGLLSHRNKLVIRH